ncbi:hypothetical protein FRC01_009464, partial [Tulasnella sp. 417]
MALFSSRKLLDELGMNDMSPSIPPQPLSGDASPPLPRQAEPIRNPQTRDVGRRGRKTMLPYLYLLDVSAGFAALYVSLALNLTLRSGELDNPVSRPTPWVTKAFGAVFVIITASTCHLAVQQLLRKKAKLQGPPAIQIFDPIGHSVQEGEIIASSPDSPPSGSAVPGTLQPPIVPHPPESALWRGPRTTHTTSIPGPQPLGPPRQLDIAETNLLDVPSQPTNVARPAGGKRSHAVPPVLQTPPPHSSLQEATNQGPATTASQSASWGTPSDLALHQWTFYLPLDREKFGRVRKQPKDTQAVFSSPNCDVWKCEVEFTKPSNENPDKVAVKVVRHHVQGESDRVKVLERMNA